MRFIKRLIIFSIAVFSLVLTHAQTVEQTYRIAVKSLESGDTLAASSFFHRVSYFDTSGYYKSLSNFNLAQIAFRKKEYEKSIKYAQWAYFASPNDSLSNEITFFAAYVHLLRKDYVAAEEELLNIDTSLSLYDRKRYDLYMGTLGFVKHDFKMAYKYFGCLYNDTVALKQLLHKARKISQRKSLWYFLASAVIPGSGQVMTGHLKQGLNSLALLSGLAYLFVTITGYYSWLEGFAVVFPWYERYFFGGTADAYDYAEILKARKLSVIYQTITAGIR